MSIINVIIEKVAKTIGFSVEGTKKYTANTMWLFSERFVTLFIGFFVGVAVIRYLAPHDYGIIAYGSSIFSIIYSISSLNLNDVVIRETIKNPDNEHKLLGTVFIMRCITSITLFIFATFYAYFSTESTYFLAVLLIIISVFLAPFITITTYFNTVVKSKYAAASVTLSYIVASIVKVMFIIAKAPLIYFAIATSIFYILQIFIVTYLYKKHFKNNKKWTFDFNIMKNIISSYWMLFVIIIITSVISRVDILMLKSFFTNSEVGIYNSAFRLVEIWYALPTIIFTSVFPAILAAKNSNEQEYIVRLSKVLRLTTFLAVGFGVSLFFLSGIVIKILYGDAYASADTVLVIISWGLLFFTFSLYTTKWLIAENYIKLMLLRTIISSAVSLPLAYLLIKNYGLIGTSISFVIIMCIQGYLIDVVYKETRELFIIKTKSIVYPITYLISKIK